MSVPHELLVLNPLFRKPHLVIRVTFLHLHAHQDLTISEAIQHHPGHHLEQPHLSISAPHHHCLEAPNLLIHA